jgi:LPS-assembly protein
MISYEGAVLEVSGVPILYLPYFAHPDPSAGPRSGFLTPDLGTNRRLGTFYNQPYYWRISPYQDLTPSLEVHEKVNPLGQLDYRKRFYSGDLAVQTSFTYEYDFDGEGQPVPGSEESARSHVFSSGNFAINDYWRWGFGAERTSDDTYLQRYGIDGMGERRGPFVGDQLRLLSQLFVQGQDENSYSTINFLSIQGLRTTDNPGLLPLVLPLGEFDRVWREPVLNGQIKLHGSTAVLLRSADDVFAFDDPERDTDADGLSDAVDPDDDNDGVADGADLDFDNDGIADADDEDVNNDGVDDDVDGVDDARVSIGASWRGEYVVGPGWVVSPFAEGRVDGFYVDDPQAAEQTTFARPVGDVGVEVSWPFMRPGDNVDLIVEPVAVAVIGAGENDPRIVNIDNGGEDSILFELDDSNLFRSNAVPNYDVWDTGNRASLGVRAAARAAGGQSANFLFGRRWRSENDPVFEPSSNLNGHLSDWVGAASIDLGPNFGATVRARLEDDSFEFSRLDASVRASLGRFSAQARYYSIDQNFIEAGDPASELTTNVGVQLVRGWELQYGLRRDLDQDINLSQNLRAIYRDDCTFLELSYTRNEIQHGPLGPDEGFQIRVGLTSLGVFGGGD